MDKVHPLFIKCQQSLEDYKQDITNQKLILSRFDEVLLEKASKFSVNELANDITKYSLKTDFNNLINQINIKTNENKNYIKKVKNLCHESLEKVHEDVKETITEMEKAIKARTQEFLNKNTIHPEEI